MSPPSDNRTLDLTRFPISPLWLVLQAAFWLVGAAITIALVLRPPLGLFLLWSVLIPVAPALLVISPAFWRNVCPLGSTSLLPRRLGLSARWTLPDRWRGRLILLAVLLLLVLAPLRHVALDKSGPATALVLALAAAAAVAMGCLFEWKSGWCSSLCPVFPVEQLYGSEPVIELPNAHCVECESCVTVCADSTPGIDPTNGATTPASRAAGVLMAGGFAGFVWGWFQVPSYAWPEGFGHLAAVYGWPAAGIALTLTLFLFLRRVLPASRRWLLIRFFAAAAISLYYGFWLPAQFGFGPVPARELSPALAQFLSPWFPHVLRLLTTGLFFWLLVIRATGRRRWAARPEFSPQLRLRRAQSAAAS